MPLNRKTKKYLKITAIIFAALLFVLAAGFFLLTRLSSPVTQNLDDYVYGLPFAPGARFKVVQGYGGLFSHKNTAALDFGMPEGTPIHAAREGVVFSYRDNYDEGGPWPKYRSRANYIMIRHSDGSYGCYWHLQKNGVLVKKGPVAKGQLIGYSGATGFVLRPHLHFSVKRALNYDMDSFVRTKFRTGNGVELLQRGNKYTRPAD